MHNRLSDKEVVRIERGFDRTRRAWELLDIIAAEFESDPLSVQCFDLRIVEEVKKIIRTQKQEARWSEPLGEK